MLEVGYIFENVENFKYIGEWVNKNSNSPKEIIENYDY